MWREPLEWSCHFCGEVRPDEVIAVESVTVVMAVDIPVRMNRRYCSDREKCRDDAKAWAKKTLEDHE